METYQGFGRRTAAVRDGLVALLRDLKRSGATIAGYGAPAKGNTLLNYCSITTDLISFTVDRNPVKQDRFLPGSHIPIFHPDRLWSERPDYIHSSCRGISRKKSCRKSLAFASGAADSLFRFHSRTSSDDGRIKP